MGAFRDTWNSLPGTRSLGGFLSGVTGIDSGSKEQSGSFATGQTIAGFLDPANFFGIQKNPLEDWDPGAAYQVDPNAFLLGTAGQDKYGIGGVGGTFLNRQINPEMQAMLLAQAQGRVPSAAEIQMQDALRRNQAAAQSLMSSNANMAPALAARMALDAQNKAGLQTQAQGAALRADEMSRGREMLSNYLLNQQSQNDQMVRYYQSLGYSADEAAMKAQMALQALNADNYNQMKTREFNKIAGIAGAQQAQQAGIGSAAGAIVGGIVAGPGGAKAGSAAGSSMSNDSGFDIDTFDA